MLLRACNGLDWGMNTQPRTSGYVITKPLN